MNGDVAFDSQVGVGSTFYLTLSLDRLGESERGDAGVAAVRSATLLEPVILQTRKAVHKALAVNTTPHTVLTQRAVLTPSDLRRMTQVEDPDPASPRKVDAARPMSPTIPDGLPVALLVDDSPVNLRLLVRWTHKSNVPIHVMTAVNGREAVDTWQRHRDRIGVILMDVNMPVMNGLDATR